MRYHSADILRLALAFDEFLPHSDTNSPAIAEEGP